MAQLPPALAPWADSLAHLDPALATDIGPMLHILDELVGRLDQSGAEAGDPDGFDGIDNRADPSRLLISEWLLADEIPLEFLRRAAEGELNYLRRALRAPQPKSRVIAVVDSGPDQLGSGRLVQLAALVVLDRRARAAGSELGLIVLQEPDEVRTGDLPTLLLQWLHSRTARAAEPEHLDRAFALIDHPDRAWVVGGPTAVGLAPGHRRLIHSQVVAWDTARAAAVRLGVGNSRTELRLPRSPASSIRALRGDGLLVRADTPTVGVPSTGRGVCFASNARALLWRGDASDELYSVSVPQHAGQTRKVKRHRLPGVVLAAAVLSRRTVALVTDGERAWVHVIGKRLARVDEISVPLDELGLAGRVEEALAQPVRPLLLAGLNLWVQVLDQWWELSERAPVVRPFVAVAPGRALDTPRFATITAGQLVVDGRSVGSESSVLLLGTGHWFACTDDGRHWRVRPDNGLIGTTLDIGPDDHAIAVTHLNSRPALVAVSSSSRIVRVVSEHGTKTLTSWAGPAQYAVHPVEPWLARVTSEEIKVGHLGTGELLLRVGVTT